MEDIKYLLNIILNNLQFKIYIFLKIYKKIKTII